MRIWSLHPALLDRAGLVAGWREGLLAQKVLRGDTKGYRHHPQLVRFSALADPLVGIATYLNRLADEAETRGYRFDRRRLRAADDPALRMDVTDGQLAYEWAHLRAKVVTRAPEWASRFADAEPRAHPIFRVIPGEIEIWERPKG